MTDESIFREVDEEVRQDEYKKLWDRFGKAIIAVVTGIILAIGGYEAYKYYVRTQSEQAAVVYFDALKKAGDGKFDDASAALKAINHRGFQQLAILKEAELTAERGDTKKAVAALDAFIADSSNDKSLVELALIKSGYILLDTTTPDQLLTRLGKFDNDKSVWRHPAREIFGLAAWRIGDYRMADRYMKALYDDAETPPAMRQRAQMMVQLLAPHLEAK